MAAGPTPLGTPELLLEPPVLEFGRRTSGPERPWLRLSRSRLKLLRPYSKRPRCASGLGRSWMTSRRLATRMEEPRLGLSPPFLRRQREARRCLCSASMLRSPGWSRSAGAWSRRSEAGHRFPGLGTAESRLRQHRSTAPVHKPGEPGRRAAGRGLHPGGNQVLRGGPHGREGGHLGPKRPAQQLPEGDHFTAFSSRCHSPAVDCRALRHSPGLRSGVSQGSRCRAFRRTCPLAAAGFLWISGSKAFRRNSGAVPPGCRAFRRNLREPFSASRRGRHASVNSH